MEKNEYRKKSIRYLRAIEAYEGGRAILAQKLGCTKAAIDQWNFKQKVSPDYVLKLSKLCEGRFTTNELLGENDE